MEEVESGKVAAVITKDLSRLGRNQLHTGLYIEEIFLSYNVRYIAINDNVDTLYETSNELMPFKNLFNEWHVRKRPGSLADRPADQRGKGALAVHVRLHEIRHLPLRAEH